MAGENPTGGKRAVPVDLPPTLLRIVRQNLESCLEGAESDLELTGKLREPDKVRSNANAYKRLLAGLGCGAILLPDEDARKAVEEMAISSDEGTSYEEVVAEHDALYGLLGLLGGKAE